MKELLETGVATNLGYNTKCDALVGKVKELEVVVKENDQTKSYGCLIWVRKKNSTSDDELYSYLSGQVADKPHIIKHFKTTGRGAALALVKYNDPVRNINNLNRFLGDLANDLYAHDYVNCCYACGGTDGLGIYADGGSVVQYCGSCAKGTPVVPDGAEDQEGSYGGEAYAAPGTAQDEPAAGDDTVYGEDPFGGADDLMAAMAAAAVEIRAEETAGSMEDLLADMTVPSGGGNDDGFSGGTAREVISTADDSADLSSLFADEKDDSVSAAEALEAVRSEFGDYEEETFTAQTEEPDNALDGLMFTEAEPAKEEAPAPVRTEEPAFGEANIYIEESGSGDLGGLMFDGMEAPAEETDPKPSGEDVDGVNIYGLMLGSEQENDVDAEVTEVTAVTAIGVGSGEELTVNMGEDDDDEVGIDENVEVTELHDDSNDGEDFDIQELESDFNMPTDTKGGEISASETPLEKDGSVPMVNPVSDFADTKPSYSSSAGAVRAFAYGSYENANTAEEPVRFDGRPKDYKGSDPRLGDEMGSVSRDFRRQNAALHEPPKPTGYRVVSKAGASRYKPIKQPKAAYSYGSNAVLGIIAALLFGLIGCALWCGTCYLLGMMKTFDSNVVAIVLAVLGCLPALAVFLGYRIGGDCYDTKGMVISAVLTLILDVVGFGAVLIVGEMQSRAEELGFNLPLDKAYESVVANLSDPVARNAMMLQIAVTAVVMVVSLVVGIVVAKKSS